MKKLLIILLLPALLAGCKSKKKNLKDVDAVEIGDFIDFFDEKPLPLQLADSSFHKGLFDSTAISYAIFNKFIPDSVLSKQFGKGARPRIYPAGKVSIKKHETYLFVKVIGAGKKAAYVLVFDVDGKFAAGMPVIVEDKEENIARSAMLDKKYTLFIIRQRKNAERQMVYKRTAYIFNSAGVFTLILTESNDQDAIKNILINPIDTLARKNKLSGDYVKDHLNLVSIRDGRNTSEYLFFVHFEQDGGACKGELKGAAKIIGPNKAVYRQSGDHCVLQFTFTGNTVTIKEDEACGSHRDIKCFFEGTFVKKRIEKRKK